MLDKSLQKPQRQSVLGILFIFIRIIYALIKGFWPFILLILARNRGNITLSLGILTGIFALLIIISFLSYRRFLFHIDIENKKFVLQRGILSTKIIEIPFDKIQQIDTKASIIQQFLGVSKLSIDTAGTSGQEIQIQALKEDKAEAIRDIIRKEIQDLADSENNKIDNTIEADWIHRLNVINLFKIGITRSYLRGFLLILAFLFTLYGQFAVYIIDYVEENHEYFEELSLGITIISIFLILTFLLSIFITVMQVVIKHFNLIIKQNKKYLEVEMGLKNLTKVSFQSRRLQYLKVLTNPIQKRINLYEAQMALASTQNHLDNRNIIVPGLTTDLINKIQSFLYTKALDENQRKYKPHLRWINRRLIVLFIILFTILGFWFSVEEEMQWIPMSIFSLIYLGILFPYQYAIYKSIRLNISNDFLIIDSGFWTQTREIVELYKMQGVSVRQPFWYKKMGLYNLSFHTAGGDISLRAVPKSVLKEINYILYKVEISDKAWM